MLYDFSCVITNLHSYHKAICNSPLNQTDLNSFLELDAEVLKDAEALVQLERVLVFTKEIDESVSLLTQIQPASLQVLESPC